MPMVGATQLTLQLTLFLGLFYLAAGLGGILRPDLWTVMMREFAASVTLGFLAGVIGFVFGAAMILAHNRWTGVLPGIVSFVGWASLVKGALLMILPTRVINLSSPFMRKPRSLSLAMFSIGIVLIIIGLFGSPDPYYDTMRDFA